MSIGGARSGQHPLAAAPPPGLSRFGRGWGSRDDDVHFEPSQLGREGGESFVLIPVGSAEKAYPIDFRRLLRLNAEWRGEETHAHGAEEPAAVQH